MNENRQRISHLSLFTVCFLTLTSTSLLMGMNSFSGADSYLAAGAGGAAAVGFFFLLIRFRSLRPEPTLGQAILNIFGKAVGRVILVLYALFSLFTGAVLSVYLTRFITVTGGGENMSLVFSLLFFTCCFLIARAGVCACARLSRLIFPFSAVLITASLLLSLYKFDPANITAPGVSLPDFLTGSVSLFLFPFCQVVLLAPFIFRAEKKGLSKPMFASLGAGAGAVSLSYLVTAGVLGKTSLLELNYPAFMALSVLNITAFFQRLEALLSIHFIVGMLLKGAVSVIFACEAAGEALSIHGRGLAAPMTALMLGLSLVLFSDSEQQFAFMRIYPFLCVPFLLAFPVIAYIVAEIKHARQNRPSKRTNAQNKPSASENT